MYLPKDLFDIISDRILAVPVHSEFQLSALLGDEWDNLGNAGQHKKIGGMFSKDVNDGQFPFARFVRVERSGRANTYVRIDPDEE